MCGIAGIVRQDKIPVERMTLERMVRAMVHRGPDDQGIWMDRSVGLGHRRLSIIDRSSGHQPCAMKMKASGLRLMGKSITSRRFERSFLPTATPFGPKRHGSHRAFV